MTSTLQRIVYRSRPTGCLSNSIGIDRIFSTSIRNNARTGVTGAMVAFDDRFVQVLEGDLRPLERLLDRIAVDHRHCDIELVERRTISARLFCGWSMARVADHLISPPARLLLTTTGLGSEVIGTMCQLASQPPIRLLHI